MKPILEVQHISKEFLIGGERERYLSLRDVVANPFKKLKQPKAESFWALNDVSINVMPGESIAIIGRNGAGKSTLLKILSKITPPTKGKIICRGRIASLLEVGTGFHPELTGRENMYMNGSILGMRKAEVDKHFDAIVDFSGIGQFLDTPLKKYSSGMQLRLAFAVAAHLEPEILVIDEVLAVGDAEFQKKCIGKMDHVSRDEGRTILFVSHNLPVVKQLCKKALYLKNGENVAFGPTDEILSIYKKDSMDTAGYNLANFETNKIKLLDVTIGNASGASEITIEDDLVIELKFVSKIENASLACSFNFFNDDDLLMFEAFAPFANDANSKKKEYSITVTVPKFTLNSGSYTASLIFGEDQRVVILNTGSIFNFTIDETFFGTGKLMNRIPGVMRPKIDYYVKEVN